MADVSEEFVKLPTDAEKHRQQLEEWVLEAKEENDYELDSLRNRKYHKSRIHDYVEKLFRSMGIPVGEPK